MRIARIVISTIVVAVICVGVVFGISAVRYDRARADMEYRFDRIIAIREKAVQDAERSKKSYPANITMFLKYEPEAIALDKLALSNSTASIYRSVFFQELKCSNQQHREIAFSMCESTFNPELAPAFARLLNDTSEVALSAFSNPPGSMNPYQRSYRYVSEYAKNALEHQTGYSFNSETAFNRWWTENGKDYSQKSWYWVAKWYHGDPRTMYYGAGIPIDDEHIRDLSHMQPGTALKILLMGKYQILNLESESDFQSKVPDCFIYNKKAFARFVRSHNLQGELISFLHQKNLYPEIDSNLRFQCFASIITDLGEYAFTAADEPAIAAAQQIQSPYKPPTLDMILLRSKIAPQRARTIIVEAMRTDPNNTVLVNELIKVAGYSETELILKVYKNSSDKDNYVHQLFNAAQNHQQVPLWLIREFARELTLDNDPDYVPYPSINNLYELCLAANKCSGKTLITGTDIEMLISQTFPDGLKPNREDKLDMARYDAQRRKAFKQVRRKLISSLETAQEGN